MTRHQQGWPRLVGLSACVAPFAGLTWWDYRSSHVVPGLRWTFLAMVAFAIAATWLTPRAKVGIAGQSPGQGQGQSRGQAGL